MTVLQCFTPLLHSVFAVQAPGKPSGLKSRGRADLMECNSSLPRAHCENTKWPMPSGSETIHYQANASIVSRERQSWNCPKKWSIKSGCNSWCLLWTTSWKPRDCWAVEPMEFEHFAEVSLAMLQPSGCPTLRSLRNSERPQRQQLHHAPTHLAPSRSHIKTSSHKHPEVLWFSPMIWCKHHQFPRL